MKGDHHEGKPKPSEVIQHFLGERRMDEKDFGTWERPGHHQVGIGDPKGAPEDFEEFDFQQDRDERWKKALKKGAVYSVKCGCAGSPLEDCGGENLPQNLMHGVEPGDKFAVSSEKYHPET